MKNNKYFLLIPAALLLLPLAYFSERFDLTYSITSKGILYPAQEWVLTRTPDGNLVNSIKDNINNSIVQYSVTEFQRGDVAGFSVIPEIFDKAVIQKGDTIGRITSQNEIGRYLELKGELDLQNKLLSVYSSGAKPDEIKVANERINLARQEFETQQRITERNRILFEKTYIPEEAYELSQNELNIKKQNYLIAESQYEALLSGAKKEQLDYVRARIETLRTQLNHLEMLISTFTITSPITGRISQQQGQDINLDSEIIVKISDINKFIMLVPVDVYNLPFIYPGQKIIFSPPSGSASFEGTISHIDNAIQMLNRKQKIFLTAIISPPTDSNVFYPNMLMDVSIPSENLTIREYASRIINEIYNN